MNLVWLIVFALVSGSGHAYEIIKVEGGGEVVGIVKFKGKPPAAKKMPVPKDEGVCGKGERVVNEVSLSQNGGILNAVVYLEGVAQGKDWKNPSEAAELVQKGCSFVPPLLVMPKGRDLAIVNSDPVAHNVHIYEVMGRVRSTLFNIAQPRPNRIVKPIKPRRSNAVKVECDIHNFMHGWIFAADNPYYAVTDEQGRFSVADIPPGKYKIKVWHPVLGIKESEVIIAPGKQSAASFEWGEKQN